MQTQQYPIKQAAGDRDLEFNTWSRGFGIEVFVRDDGETIGRVKLEKHPEYKVAPDCGQALSKAKNKIGDVDIWSVMNAHLEEPYRGEGIGTDMYVAAIRKAAETGGVVVPGDCIEDTEGTSAAARRVWRSSGLKKQVDVFQDLVAWGGGAGRTSSKSYYDLTKPEPIPDITDRWANRNEQLYDAHIHAYYPVEDLWPYREYTWTRDTARGGMMKIDGEWVDLRGPQKWDALVEDMKEHGWRKDHQPVIVQVGKNGEVKVGEGNHRLAIARKIGLREVPVRFDFRNSVSGGEKVASFGSGGHWLVAGERDFRLYGSGVPDWIGWWEPKPSDDKIAFLSVDGDVVWTEYDPRSRTAGFHPTPPDTRNVVAVQTVKVKKTDSDFGDHYLIEGQVVHHTDVRDELEERLGRIDDGTWYNVARALHAMKPGNSMMVSSQGVDKKSSCGDLFVQNVRTNRISRRMNMDRCRDHIRKRHAASDKRMDLFSTIGRRFDLPYTGIDQGRDSMTGKFELEDDQELHVELSDVRQGDMKAEFKVLDFSGAFGGGSGSRQESFSFPILHEGAIDVMEQEVLPELGDFLDRIKTSTDRRPSCRECGRPVKAKYHPSNGWFDPDAILRFSLSFREDALQQDLLEGDPVAERVHERLSREGEFEELQDRALLIIENATGKIPHTGEKSDTNRLLCHMPIKDRGDLERTLDWLFGSSRIKEFDSMGRIHLGKRGYFLATGWNLEVPDEGTFDIFGTAPGDYPSLLELIPDFEI